MTHSESNQEQKNPTPAKRGRTVLIVIVALIGVAALVVTGIVPRLRDRKALAAETERLATPAVLVVEPQKGSPAQEIVLPGNIQAFVDAPIYARTNGYLKHWYFDIGAKVRKGQLLADIESPEIDQQLAQAQAELATAVANANLAKVTANRYTTLLASDSVSKQDTDNAVSDLAAKNTTVQSQQANVNRLKQLVDFEKIYAPFDGVITARNTDTGQLIDSGASGGAAKELFHIAAVNRLRVFINVPQIYSPAATPGLTADLTFAEYAGRKFAGKLVRTAKSIDPTSRTLLVEVDVDNAKGELLPGAFAEVHLKTKTSEPVLILPVSTLLFRAEGLQVGVVKEDNRAALRAITIGRDLGDAVEVTTGLEGNERVITNPPDSLVDGEKVTITTPKKPGAATSGSGGGTK